MSEWVSERKREFYGMKMPHHSINWNIDSARKLKLQLDIVLIESVEKSGGLARMDAC